jgi:hypothetical protein
MFILFEQGACIQWILVHRVNTRSHLHRYPVFLVSFKEKRARRVGLTQINSTISIFTTAAVILNYVSQAS